MNTDNIHFRLRLIDYFVDKNGGRFIGILEVKI